jgi:hypothetical protein
LPISLGLASDLKGITAEGYDLFIKQIKYYGPQQKKLKGKQRL